MTLPVEGRIRQIPPEKIFTPAPCRIWRRLLYSRAYRQALVGR